MKKTRDKIKEALTRGVDKIYPSLNDLEKRTHLKKKMRIYCGYDPTGPKLHLGHLFTILKLADFQSLGHEVIMLVGDFTGTIGDPTDKSEARKKLTRKEVLFNSRNYKKIAGKFLEFSGSNPAKLMYNSKWNKKLSYTDVIELASNFTVQQMIVRDMFQERIKKEKPIYLHEFLYPLTQAYDSVAMNVDLEVGGRDQIFNMLCGRDLMKILKGKEKFVLGTKLLVDVSGKKVGKTEGATVWLNEKPEMIYGKIMSWPDELIVPALEGCTRVPIKEIEKKKKEGPLKLKMFLAKEIASMCHNSQKADKAEKEFIGVFQKKQLPSKIKEVKIKKRNVSLPDLLIDSEMVSSKAEARRVIKQKGVKINGEIKSDWKEKVFIEKGTVVSVGKRNFVRII